MTTSMTSSSLVLRKDNNNTNAMMLQKCRPRLDKIRTGEPKAALLTTLDAEVFTSSKEYEVTEKVRDDHYCTRPPHAHTSQ